MIGENGISRRNVLSAAGGALALGTLTPPAAGTAGDAPEPADALSAHRFGAVGDGAADDTGALQAALDATFDPDPTQPGLLVIPPGEYRITRGLHIRMRENLGRQRRVTAYGARIKSTIADGAHVLHVHGDSIWRFLIIEGLEIDGSGQDGHGVFLDCDSPTHSIYNFCLRDLVVQGCGGDGCRLYGDVFESQLMGCAFRGNLANGATFAHSPHGGVLSSMQVFGCAFDDNEGHGGEIVRSYDVGFHGCDFSRNGRFGLLAANGCELVLDCRFEDNHRAAFTFIDGGAGMGLRRYATLVGCSSRSSASQTHLIDADLTGSFARLVMIGCTALGEGPAAGSGLARLRGGRGVDATIIGCRGAVTTDRMDALEISGPQGGIGFSAGWRGTNLFRMGDHRLWVDKHGRLRLKAGAPDHDEDGAPVGG